MERKGVEEESRGRGEMESKSDVKKRGRGGRLGNGRMGRGRIGSGGKGGRDVTLIDEWPAEGLRVTTSLETMNHTLNTLALPLKLTSLTDINATNALRCYILNSQSLHFK